MSENYAKEFYIPPNFKTGINIMGKTFSVASLTEGAVLALLPIVIVFYILPKAGVEVSWKTGSTIVTFASVILGYLGIKGINGYSLTQFIKSIMRYRKNKRVCYYNPRIKTEASPYNTSNVAEQMLPKEKLEQFYATVKKKYDARQRAIAVEEQKGILTNRENMFFIDDAGVVDTPVEYMDSKEYKEYKKKLKKEEQQKKKEERLKKKNADRQKKGGSISERSSGKQSGKAQAKKK